MIQKIISSGQPGAGRGALIAATALDIPYAGWTPEGSFSNGDPFPKHDYLKNSINGKAAAYIEKNANAADGTLIIINGVLSGESAIAQDKTIAVEKPWLLIDLGKMENFKASQAIHEWLSAHGINRLYVTGASVGESQKIERVTQNMIEAVYYLGLIENNMAASATLSHDHGPDQTASSLEDAVSLTISNMSLKDRVTMANLSESELTNLQPTLGAYLRQMLPQWLKNPAFLSSLDDIEKTATKDDDLVFLIIRRIWTALSKTHKLRIIK